MRSLALLLTLLAAAAFAQPHVSDEIASSAIPFSRPAWPTGQPAVAIAADRDGVAIAWSMPDSLGVERLFVARLDAGGHVSGAVREMPTFDPQRVAFGPSIARDPGGSGFTIAWVEAFDAATAQTPHVIYTKLDASLAPGAPRRLFIVPAGSAVIVRSAARTWATSNSSVAEILPTGEGATAGSLIASDMIVAGDVPQMVAHQTLSRIVRCACDPGPHAWGCTTACPAVYDNQYSLQFLSLYAYSDGETLPFGSDAQPAIGSDGKSLFVAWMNAPQQRCGEVSLLTLSLGAVNQFPLAFRNSRTIGTFNADSGATRPDIASDGSHTVIVWRNRTTIGDHDVAGAAIDREGRVVNFSIAASSSDERDPSIVALGNGRFLVAYETISVSNQRRIAGRFITFDERRRAAQVW